MNWPWSRKQQKNRTRVLEFGGGGALLRPIDPPLAPRLSSGKARDAVYKAISELAPTGALDAGNGDVLDAWIDQLRPQWLAHHTMVEADRQAAAQLAAGEYEAAAAAARHRADAAKARRDGTQRLLKVYEQRLIGPTETDPIGHPDRRRRPRPALDTLEGLTPQWTWRIVSLVLLLAAAAGDFANFWTVLAGLTGEDGTMLWILTAAFAAAAVGLMHVAGRTARNLREGQGGLGRVALTVVMTAWTALGVAAFYVRTQVNSDPGATAAEILGDPAAASAATGPDPILQAVLLAGLYVGAGLLAFVIGFADHHPRMTPFLKLRKELRLREEEAAAAEQKAIEAERLRDNAQAELERTKARIAAAELSVDAEIAELKELARLHVAGYIGEPAATNNLTTGRSVERSTVSAKAGTDIFVPAPSEPADENPNIVGPPPALTGEAGRGPTR